MTTEQIEIEAMKLPTGERTHLVETLIRSLEEGCAMSDEWKEEITNRCKELDDGTAELIPASEVFAELRSQLP